jgi:hypothetical protein
VGKLREVEILACWEELDPAPSSSGRSSQQALARCEAGAPEFDEDRYRDESYRNELGGYYSRRRGAGTNEPPQAARTVSRLALPAAGVTIVA